MKSSFLILFSFICLQGFSKVVGILLFRIEGSICLLFGGVFVKIVSLLVSCMACITFSWIRWAGALYVKFFISSCVIGIVAFGSKVVIIWHMCLFSVLNM